MKVQLDNYVAEGTVIWISELLALCYSQSKRRMSVKKETNKQTSEYKKKGGGGADAAVVESVVTSKNQFISVKPVHVKQSP